MAVDDNPLDALERQFQMEDLSVSPVTRAVSELASKLSLPWPFDKIVETVKGHIAADSLERIHLMLTTCIAEVRKHEGEIRQLQEARTAEETRAHEEISRELLLDAARKAENTRAKDRVARIGRVLAHGIVEAKPTSADEIEEMMRVAMELSDRDIVFLRELVRIEGVVLETQDHIPRYDAYLRWEQGFWGARVIPEVDSVFSKLESYGLVARIAPPNNLTVIADEQNRYVLLPKGVRFVALIHEAALART